MSISRSSDIWIERFGMGRECAAYVGDIENCTFDVDMK